MFHLLAIIATIIIIIILIIILLIAVTAIADTRHLHRHGTDARQHIALGQMTVADETGKTVFGPIFGMRGEQRLQLCFDSLLQQLARTVANEIRERIGGRSG